jgi:predicted nucleic acid-binding protein
MAQILKLSEKLPESFSHYFFDSNVWIAFLKYNHKNNADRRFTPYIDLFEGVVQLNAITEPKLQRKVKHIPKIVMTSMLLSEIINTYLRVVAMPSFLNKPNSDFKKEYRNNIHSDYDKQLKILLDDLKSYSFIYEYVKDDFNELNPMELLSDLNRKVDFNDLYYMKLMEKYQYVIVTDDGDFDSHEITVLTENKNLLSKQ